MPGKKAAQATPNYLLRRARQERGWSQQEVAERIGAPQAFLVTRWERGTALPGAHYRQKLAELFGKSALELGLLQIDSAVSTPSNPHGSIFDPTIPLPLAKTHALVGRDSLLVQLKQRLCTRENVALNALIGIPGVGKTALAVALVNDADVQEYFRDGILWVGLGPEPNVIGLLSRWGKLLGMAENEAAGLRRGDDWAMALHALIGKRQMLLIIDDAWTIEDALTFKTGGPNCAHLLTTRLPVVATRFTGEQAIQVQELDADDGFLLLSRLAPTVIKAEPEEAQALVQAVGGLPLALTLMGNYLSVEARHQQRRRIRGALNRLQLAEERLRLEQPQAGLEHHSSLAGSTPLSLQAVIGISANYLDDAARHALRTLSLFPARPNTFSEDAALAASDCSVEVLDALVDAGLIECVGADRYTLHQTISNYARVYMARIVITEVAQKLVAYMVSFVQAHAPDCESLETESANIVAALQLAHEQGLNAELIRGVHAFTGFLQVQGAYALAEELLQKAHQAASTLNNTAALAATLLYQGEIAEKLGNYQQAEAYLQEGLALARQRDMRQLMSNFLHDIGVTTYDRGEYTQAEIYLQEGLTLARQLGDNDLVSKLLTALGAITRKLGNYAQARTFLQEGLTLARQCDNRMHTIQLLIILAAIEAEQSNYAQSEKYAYEGLALAYQIGHRDQISQLLANIGSVAGKQGNHVEAEEYLRESLAIARQIGHRAHICRLLLNMGASVAERGNYIQAEVYFQEGLTMAYQIGHREQIGIFLLNLGDLAWLRGDSAKAEAYFQEGLSLARQIGHSWLISTILGDMGEVYFKQGQLDAATLAYNDLLESAPQGNREVFAVAHYGLAQIAATHNEMAEARRMGEASLKTFEEIRHPKAAEARVWLDALPVKGSDDEQ